MADFQPALSFTLAREGGLQSYAADRGNQQADGSVSHTNAGITLGTLKSWRAYSNQPVPTDQDVVALTAGEVARIYSWLCWMPIMGNQLASQPLATVLFDSCVLCGTNTAVRALQQVVAAMGYPLLADGQLGPRSLAAINACAAIPVLHLLIDRHSDRFADIVIADASQVVFLANWRNRRSRWRQLALAG